MSDVFKIMIGETCRDVLAVSNSHMLWKIRIPNQIEKERHHLNRASLFFVVSNGGINLLRLSGAWFWSEDQVKRAWVCSIDREVPT